MRGKLLGTIALRQREVMSSRNAAGRGILSPISGGAFGLRQSGYADMAQKSRQVKIRGIMQMTIEKSEKGQKKKQRKAKTAKGTIKKQLKKNDPKVIV